MYIHEHIYHSRDNRFVLLLPNRLKYHTQNQVYKKNSSTIRFNDGSFYHIFTSTINLLGTHKRRNTKQQKHNTNLLHIKNLINYQPKSYLSLNIKRNLQSNKSLPLCFSLNINNITVPPSK